MVLSRFWRKPDQTQITIPAVRKQRTETYSHEHHNLATEYLYGKENSKTKLTFDEYIKLVNGFSVMAQSVDIPKSEDVDALIDGAIAGEIMQLPASPEDFERAYKDAFIPLPTVIEAVLIEEEEYISCEIL